MKGTVLFSCPETPARFTAYLDGELPVSDARDLDAHLEGCPACRRAATDLAETHRDLALMSALESSAECDPVPALLAKARWDEAAGSRRLTRVRRAARRRFRGDFLRPSRPLAAAAVAAVLFVILGIAAYVSSSSRPVEREAPMAERKRIAPLPVPSKSNEKETLPIPPQAPPTPSPNQRLRAPFEPGVEREPTEAPAPPRPKAPPPGKTVVEPAIIARIEGAEGGSVRAGQSIRTGRASWMTLVFPDGTRIRIGALSSVEMGSGPNSIHLASGQLVADVRPRRSENRFMVTTPNAKVRVLGTRLRVTARPGGTRVGVEKGRVRVHRAADNRVIFVSAGQFTVVSGKTQLRTFPLEANLLPNPGLEEGQTGWRWTSPPVVSGTARTGSNSIRIDAVARLNENRQEPAVTAGARYRASVWVRTDNLHGLGASLRLVWHDAAGQILRTDVAGRVTGTNGWTQLEGTFTAPAGAVATFFQVLTEAEPDGAGTAWFDDCSFVELSR